MAEIAIALLMFVLIALLAVIMLDAQHPESQLLRALRGWQSGISMLFGFADLIVANQLQYENSIRLKVIEARVDERNIALALYADVTAQEAFLVGMRWHEDVVSNLAEQMKPKGGWASNAQDREIFCGLVKTHYIGIRVPDLGLFERLKSELGKLAPATVQGYLAFRRDISSLNTRLSEDPSKDCCTNPDAWKSVYADRIGEVREKAELLKTALLKIAE